MIINVRASRGTKPNLKEHRWFHKACWNDNDLGWDQTLDFPDRATSEHTTCRGCHLPINR